ncbi:MAG: DUF4893 domain-containing protein [Tagaea sp.]|nr:DUF4893 domain-containing protein [Tagaea sp.]
MRIDAIDDARTRRNHGGMKRIVLALFLAWAPPVAGQTPPADWRAIVSERDRDFIENWERYFERAIERAARPDPYRIREVDVDGLRARARLPFAAFEPQSWAGRRPCRLTTLLLGVTDDNAWLHCRVYFDGKDWWIEKRSGQHYLSLRLYPDLRFGVVAIGAEGYGTSRDIGYGEDPGRNAIGIFFRSKEGQLQLIVPRTGVVLVLDIDLRRQLRNQDVQPRERGRPAAPNPGRGDSAQ